MSDNLQNIDDDAAAVQKTPNRVTLETIQKRIQAVEYIHPKSKPSMTIAVITHINGFVVTGFSSPADPANFDQEFSRKRAYEQAINTLWGHEAFAMCEKGFECT